MTAASTSDNLLTVITVYADYHAREVERAAASVAAQSLPCDFICLRDDTGSPARGRNDGVTRAKTPLVTFLDADDSLHPSFAKTCVRAWRAGLYVYTDYEQDGAWHRMPDCMGCEDLRTHLVNAVMSRRAFAFVGGFREGVPMEDTEFWFRVMAHGIKGVRVPEPLVVYNGEGMRSHIARDNPNFSQILREYKRRNPPMACCGKTDPKNKPAQGDVYQEGMVKATANWGGNRIQVGMMTGHKYPRTGNGRELWVWPEDAQARPDLFVVKRPQFTQEMDVDIEAQKAQIEALMAAGA